MNYHAPVLVSVYNRLQHFTHCIESLAKNSDAKETPLFIAIDAPFREEDVEPNEKIRRYAKNITGFKSVHLFSRERNMGARKNVLDARQHIFSEYPSLIMSEDDNVFSPFFLSFINQGLSLYEHNEKVFSISGYNYLIEIPKTYTKDFYFAQAFSAWGVGLWKEKLKSVDFETEDFWYAFRNPIRWRHFNRALGDHVFTHLLTAKTKGEIYGDTAICYHHYKYDLVSLFPRLSLVRNIGNDGSGLHCGKQKESKFDNQKIWETAPAPNLLRTIDCEPEDTIHSLLRVYFRVLPLRKIIYFIKYIIYSFRKTI